MKPLASVAIGFDADEKGNGVAYARVGAERTLRVPFVVERFPALLSREVGYAAVTAVCRALQTRGLQRAELVVEDEHLAADLREHRDVPSPLTLAYVRLRCALNVFQEYRIAEPPQHETDLSVRARSDVAMHVAA